MRIYTPAGDLAFKEFDFSDSQPHFKLETIDDSGFTTATVEMALASPRDLLMAVLVSSVLRAQGYTEINLDVRYLLGARMDRALSGMEPFTLDAIARIINSCGFAKVRILDAHSEVATNLIRHASNVVPYRVVQHVIKTISNPLIVCPDKGAVLRTMKLAGQIHIKCGKARNPSNGKLLGFNIEETYGNDLTDKTCLIIDDVCDGGGTFAGIAKLLREAGAGAVHLYVTHGIFSKGPILEGIDHIFTTDSRFGLKEADDLCGNEYIPNWTVIPISMKDL